jgi:hypothetical protein
MHIKKVNPIKAFDDMTLEDDACDMTQLTDALF